MTLAEIYDRFIPGSTGFAQAVENHCGFGITRTEIKRIGHQAVNADAFEFTFANEDWWSEEKIERDYLNFING